MFGSNVTPRRFGAGAAPSSAWNCRHCGASNARYWSKCGKCGSEAR